MGSVKRIGDTYYIEFLARGLVYQQKAGPDKAAAEQLLAEVEAKIQAGEWAAVPRDIDVDIFFAEYGEYAARQYPRRTLDRIRSLSGHFCAFVHEHQPAVSRISQVTPSVLGRYRAFLFSSAPEEVPRRRENAVNLAWVLLSDVFSFAVRQGHLNDDPLLHIPCVRVCEKRQPRQIRASEIEKILPQLPLDIRPVAEFVRGTGFSLKDAAGLRWEDVDESVGFIAVPRVGPDGRRDIRRLPLRPQAKEFLARLAVASGKRQGPVFRDAQGRAWDEATLSSAVRSAWAQCPSPAASPGCLRNIFVKDYLSSGLSLFSLAMYMGWDDVARVICFVRFLPEQRTDLHEGAVSAR